MRGQFAFDVNVVYDSFTLNSDPLLNVDKEELVRTIRGQEQQIEKLRREVDTLRQELDKLKDRPSAPAKKQAPKPPGDIPPSRRTSGAGRRATRGVDVPSRIISTA